LSAAVAVCWTLLAGCGDSDNGDGPADDAAEGSGDDHGDHEDHADHGDHDDSTGDGGDDGADDGADDGVDDGVDDGPGTDDGVPADCTDQMILDLGLVEGQVSLGTSTDEADADDWVSRVDATAGGIVDAATNPWLYLRFTDDGFEKVEIDDLAALDSTDWDIAAKRFGIRLNSGVSGPSTVTAALVTDVGYAELTELPDTAALLEESFYDGQCNLIDDGTGQGAPNYALTQWWFYPGCVGTTGTPFVLELADGRRVKFLVESYYEQGQETCNTDGTMGMGSANFTWRWAYLSQ
ncbi:MAG: HmuY family protein, partial [Myxococcota bacterium]